ASRALFPGRVGGQPVRGARVTARRAGGARRAGAAGAARAGGCRAALDRGRLSGVGSPPVREAVSAGVGRSTGQRLSGVGRPGWARGEVSRDGVRARRPVFRTMAVMNKAFTRESDGADDDDDAAAITPPELPAGTKNYLTPAGYA